MKIYEISSDVDIYQWLIPNVPDSEILEYTTFDCIQRFSSWLPPKVYILDPPGREGDFAYFTPGVLVAGPSAIGKVRPFFEMAGELLPFWCEGDAYTLLNVTACVDALNHEKTEWHKAEDGSRVSIKNICFDKDKLNTLTSSIFKIPETRRGSVLTWEKDGNPENEFKAFVEENGLTGLLFEELWNAENEGL